MSWRDRLQRAQWRGIEFLTEQHEAKEGRRLAVHELPGGDVPVVEDLGAKARGWRVSAYFVGPDYDQARDRFLLALRTPGAEWLMHPWLGRVWARAQDWTVSETNAEGGMAKVSIEFVDGGGGVPQPQPDLVDAAQQAVDGYVVTGGDIAPLPMGQSAMAAYVARVRAGMDELRTALALARMPLTMARAVLAEMDSALALWQEARDLPGEYARLVNSVVGSLARRSGDLLRSGGNASAGSSASSNGSGSATSNGSSSTGSSTGSNSNSGANSAQGTGDAARARLVAALCRSAPAPGALSRADSDGALTGVDRAALWISAAAEQAARAHWLAAAAMQMALADYDTAAGRDQAMAAVETAVANALAVADDPVVRQTDPLADGRFQAAMHARAAVLAALAAQPLAPTQTRQVLAPLPAVVLAYRMGVDVDVLVARNGVPHPLFMRGGVNV